MPRQRASRAQRADRGRVTAAPATGSMRAVHRGVTPGPPAPETRGRGVRDGVARHPVSVRAPGSRGRYSCPVTRPTPRTRLLAVRRSTSVLTVGAAVAGALALSGCQVTSPQQTTVPYQPADGVNVVLGDVKVNDLVVITSAKGKEGVLSGQVINNGPQAGNRHLRQLPAVGRQLTKKVAARSTTRLVRRGRRQPRHAAHRVGRAGLDARPDHRDEQRRHQPGRGSRAAARPVLLQHHPRRALRQRHARSRRRRRGPSRHGAGPLPGPRTTARAPVVRLRRPRTCSPARARSR